MPIKLVTLNIEGSKHLDRVIPFLTKEKADVICLQEVFLKDFKKISDALCTSGKFFPTTNVNKINKYKIDLNGECGVVLLTNLPNNGIKHHYYFGSGNSPIFTDGDLIDRVLVYTEITKNSRTYRIGTTHFTWTPDGKPTEQQWKDFHNLMGFIKNFDDFILCGDFNAPRGREIFTEFTKDLKDNLPKDVVSTLDPKYHRVPTLQWTPYSARIIQSLMSKLLMA